LALWGGDDVILKQPKKAKTSLFPTHPPKTPNSNLNFFFSVQIKRLHESFEGSKSSLASFNGELSQVKVNYSSHQRETRAFCDFGGKMRFLSHNFGSKYTRRSSKSSIDTGVYVVSKRSLNQNFRPLNWRPGPIRVGQTTQNTPLCGPPPSKPLTQIKFFLWEPTRLSASVEGLNIFLAAAGGEL